jgi:hypothetical protein
MIILGNAYWNLDYLAAVIPCLEIIFYGSPPKVLNFRILDRILRVYPSAALTPKRGAGPGTGTGTDFKTP